MRFGIDRTEIQLVELVNLSNVHKIEPFYFWQLIEADKDDNKFADCAVSCNADYLVTNDRHYDILEHLEFPKIRIINAKAFLDKLESLM